MAKIKELYNAKNALTKDDIQQLRKQFFSLNYDDLE